MNTSEMDHPGSGSVSASNASRRTFLRGVGLAGAAGIAGAAGLTSPFLTTTSARASGGIILGCQAPGAWEGDNGEAPGWTVEISTKSNNSQSHALGVRSYRDTVFNADGSNGLAPWWDSDALGGGSASGSPIFPGEQGSIPLASIRPDPTTFNTTTDLDGVIKALIRDGVNKAASGHFNGTPQLTVWHEAGHLYKDNLGGLNPEDSPSGVPTSTGAAHTVRVMHTKMQTLVDQVNDENPGLPDVEYGCIIYGDINKMANDNDLQGATNWVPTAADGALDWYGIDLYYEDDGVGSDCTHGTLSSYDLVSSHLDNFQMMASLRAKGTSTSRTAPLRINICECNASQSNDSARPAYFENLAMWLSSNAGYRMLTFFPDPAGNHSVTWPYVANASTPYTISALKTIQKLYGR